MKAIKIENFVMLWYDECAVSYAQISNAICASETLEELQDAMKGVARDTESLCYFAWGYDFREQTFWAKQRTEYMGDELQERNTIIVEFD